MYDVLYALDDRVRVVTCVLRTKEDGLNESVQRRKARPWILNESRDLDMADSWWDWVLSCLSDDWKGLKVIDNSAGNSQKFSLSLTVLSRRRSVPSIGFPSSRRRS